MSIDVLINIKSQLNYETITHTAEGKLYLKDNEFYLRYNEHQDLGKTTSIVKWNEQIPLKITIIRQGDVKVKHVFQKDLTDYATYQSIQGMLEISTTTLDLSFKKESLTNGIIKIKYLLVINKQTIGKNSITILYKEIRDVK